MKSFVAGLVTILALPLAAMAQPKEPAGYLVGTAQSSFGDRTSQSYGIEGGWSVSSRLAVFGEAGGIRDTAPDSVGLSATKIANYLSVSQSAAVSYSVKQPMLFGAGGVRYVVAVQGTLRPYVLAGAGVARVTRDVTFSVGGSDVTGRLSSYGVVLGSDLAGSVTKPMVTFGGGARWAPAGRWILDVGYRYSWIATEASSSTISRVGASAGFRF